MSAASFWSDACNNAEDRPLPTLMNAAYASCGVTVMRARAVDCELLAESAMCDALLRRLPYPA
jgi:hypothetical protein